MSEKPVSYVRAAERLEAIMAEIESGTVDIDKLSALLKEADGLIKFCRDKLYKVDNEVNAILQRMSDDLSVEG
ncbi:MAG: exodeoxyribonuclease VII small subunit [Bacteroidaceae bacterium]|nr:exodeoxyribonuclease VII small subunit [Bacteroidales bacterium]MBO5263017.1 exodeoxyribonuclease VII small subunit [Bacteroidaceae bacterium]MBQ8256441.1 exodeoxyribonuclease VII small subunit [Bacteroidaceae bacterium]